MTVYGNVRRFLTEYPGSTRAVGLMRFFWALILWSRWADELLPFRQMSPDHWLMGALFFIGTSGMVVGFYSRISTFLTGCLTLYMVFVVGHIQGMESWTHHHTTFLAIGTFVLAFTPCGRSFSLDRWLAIQRAEGRGISGPEENGNLWAVRLMALQMSMVYFWGAFDKTRWAVLGGDRIEQPLMYLYFGSDYPGAWFEWAAIIVACSTVLLEYSLAFGLWFRRTRPRLMLLGILFHATLYVALPVTVFSVACIVSYLAFLDPEDVHRAVERLLGAKNEAVH